MKKSFLRHNDLLFLTSMVKEAGNIVLSYYHDACVSTTKKKDNSPVTIADERSDKYINKALQTRFPGIPVVSEEGYSEEDTKLDSYWIVDPLDGTSEFIKRSGEFTINVGLINKNEVIAGIIHQPVHNKTYVAVKSMGAFYLNDNGELNLLPVQVSKNKEIFFYRSKANSLAAETAVLKQLQARGFKVIQQPAGAALKHVQIALRNNGIYIKLSSNNEWDTAPGQLLIEETGGRVIDLYTRKPVVYGKKGFVNNPLLMLSSGFALTEQELMAMLEPSFAADFNTK